MSLEGTKGKFAVFAHHCAVIRRLSNKFQSAGVVRVPLNNSCKTPRTFFHAAYLPDKFFLQGFVVLDGSTPAKDRHARLNRFKQRQDVRIALVSVTAGGQGLDLSAASVGVFVELPPDVGWCRQACAPLNAASIPHPRLLCPRPNYTIVMIFHFKVSTLLFITFKWPSTVVCARAFIET